MRQIIVKQILNQRKKINFWLCDIPSTRHKHLADWMLLVGIPIPSALKKCHDVTLFIVFWRNKNTSKTLVMISLKRICQVRLLELDRTSL